MEVLVEPVDGRDGNRGDVPRRGVGARDNRVQIGRVRVEDHAADLLNEPVSGVLDVNELAADLQIVRILVDAEIVARLEIVLIEQLRVVVRLADRQTDEVVLNPGLPGHRRPGPVEVVVADVHFLHFCVAENL